MTPEEIYTQIKTKGTMLCVGLDTDPAKLPLCLRDLPLCEAMLEFNKAIVDATAPYCVAFKPNLAFYESCGSGGLRVLERTVEYIRLHHPEQFIIADAKRGDIGNTARMYAKTYFETMDFDAVTLSPYMGRDTVLPFLEYKGKYAVVVALSSNNSAADLQLTLSAHEQDNVKEPLYARVIRQMREVSSPLNMMFVVGATKAHLLGQIRSLAPDNFLLVPGVGAQGASSEEVIAQGANEFGGLLINSSRSVLYASGGEDFAEAAASVAAGTARVI